MVCIILLEVILWAPLICLRTVSRDLVVLGVEDSGYLLELPAGVMRWGSREEGSQQECCSTHHLLVEVKKAALAG